MNPFSAKTKKAFAIFLFLFTTLFAPSVAQNPLTVSEGFDQANPNSPSSWPAGNLPFGWTQGRVPPGGSNDNYWDRMNNPGTNPTCAPHNGSLAMVRFRTFYITVPGEQGFLSSKPYDLSSRPANTPSTVSFWVYRGTTAGNDNIQLYANNNPDPTVGAPALLQDAATGQTYIPRPCGTFPVDPCGAWTQHTFTVPQNTWSINNLYIIIKVTDAGAQGANVYIDDFSITTYPTPQIFNTITLDVQNTANAGKNTVNNSIIGARINVTGGMSMSLGSFIFTHNGTDMPSMDIAGAGPGHVKLWWTGGDNSFNPLTAVLAGTYAGLAFPQPSFSITAAGINLDNGNNFFWLTYDIPASATSGNHVDADFISAVVGGVTRTCGGIGCSLPGNRLIGLDYCHPVYSIGTSGNYGSYTDNDYIKTVSITNVAATDPLFTPFYNDHNDYGPSSPATAGSSDPCYTGPNWINNNGGKSTFSVHPYDYEKFPTATVPRLCSAGNCTRTTSFLSTSVSPPVYNISLQCGGWFGANYIAAFIDFNHDGAFNNVMFNFPGGEKIFQSTSMAAFTFQNGNFQIPNAGIGLPYYGETTMRVREWYGQLNIDACSQGYYGETEDYTVTIRPPCNPAGWDVWLGITDDWNTSTNWCDGVPTNSHNVLIPGTGGAGYYHPVIKSSVVAHANKLVIQSDTLQINAPVAGSLTINDSLDIRTNSLFDIKNSTGDSAMLSNGVNINTTFLPFRQSFREQKMQLMYKTSELLAMGMQNGDIVDKICVPIRQRNSTQPYNITISVYYATNNAAHPNFVNVGYSGVLPSAPTVITAPNAGVAGFPIMVYSGPVNFTAIPLGATGTYVISLTTPFTFLTAGNFPLIVEICYSNPITSSNDQTWQTQTLGYRSVLLLANLGAYPVAACAATFNQQAPSGTLLTQRLSSDLRPNLCFEFHTNYDKYPVNIQGHWKNSGIFNAGKSVVTFNGTSIQDVRGPNATTFYDLAINNNSGVKIMKSPSVSDTLNLKAGKLDLNTNSINILNPAVGGIVRTSGAILSESLPPNYGTVEWAIGNSTGSHVFPFRTSGNTYIPLTYNLISGNVGTVKAATYPTPASNLPFPTGVTNVNDTNNANNSAFTVDRFWHLEKTGPSGTTRIKFTYRNSEAPSPITNGNIRAHRYNNANDKWKILPYTMTNTINTPSPSTSQVYVFGVSGNNLGATEWALADASSPLRIQGSVPGAVEIAPNPFEDKIFISADWSSDETGNIYLTLFNILGEQVSHTVIPADLLSENEQFEWSPGDIKNGIYFLVIQTKAKVRTQRIVKMGD